MMEQKIKKTSDYDKFKMIPGNRVLYESHVNDLALAISVYNLLYANPIIVSEKMEVIDGQHRLCAAKKLEVPIYYVTVKDKKTALDAVQLLNSTVRQWFANDYIESYRARGFHEYDYLKKFMEKYSLPASTAMSLLQNDYKRASKELWSDFKHGQFTATHRTNGEAYAKMLQELRPFCQGNSWKTRGFIHALFSMYDDGNVTHDYFLSKLERYPEKVPYLVTVKQYRELFEDILAYR